MSTSEFEGVSLASILGEANVEDDCLEREGGEVIFVGKDRGFIEGKGFVEYERSLPIKECLHNQDILLSFKMNGEKLLPQHGFPVRLVVPGYYGMCSVKWLERIVVVKEPFRGPYMRAYTLRTGNNSPPQTIDKIKTRTLMIPPGVPSFRSPNFSFFHFT